MQDVELCCHCTDGSSLTVLVEGLGIIVGLVMVGLHWRHFILMCEVLLNRIPHLIYCVGLILLIKS